MIMRISAIYLYCFLCTLPLILISSTLQPICWMRTLPMGNPTTQEEPKTYICGLLDNSPFIECIPSTRNMIDITPCTSFISSSTRQHNNTTSAPGLLHDDITRIYSSSPIFHTYLIPDNLMGSSTLTCHLSFQHGHDICHISITTSSSLPTPTPTPFLPSSSVPVLPRHRHHPVIALPPVHTSPISPLSRIILQETAGDDDILDQYVLGYFCYTQGMDVQYYSPLDPKTKGLCDYSHRRVATSPQCKNECPCREHPPPPQCYFVRYDQELNTFDFIQTYDDDCSHLPSPDRVSSPYLYSQCPTIQFIDLHQDYSYPGVISMFNPRPIIMAIPLYRDFETALITGILTDLAPKDSRAATTMTIFKDKPYNITDPILVDFRPPFVSQFMITIMSGYNTPEEVTHITTQFTVHDECSLPSVTCNEKGTRCGKMSGYCRCIDGYIYAPSCHASVEVSHRKAIYLVENPDATKDELDELEEEYYLWSSDPTDMGGQISLESSIRVTDADKYGQLRFTIIIDDQPVFSTILREKVHIFSLRNHVSDLGSKVQLSFSTIDNVNLHPPLWLVPQLGCNILNQLKNTGVNTCTALKDRIQFAIEGKELHLILDWSPPPNAHPSAQYYARLFDANQSYVAVLYLAQDNSKDRVLFSEQTHSRPLRFIVPVFGFPGIAGGGSVTVLPWDILAPISLQQSYPFSGYKISACVLFQTVCPDNQPCNEYTGECVCDPDRWGSSCQYKQTNTLVSDPLDICPLSYLSCSRRGEKYTRGFLSPEEGSYCQCKCESYWTSSHYNHHNQDNNSHNNIIGIIDHGTAHNQTEVGVYIPPKDEWHDPANSAPTVQCAVCSLVCPGTMIPTDDCTACRCTTEDCTMRTYFATISFDKRTFFNYVPRPRRKSFMSSLRIGLYRIFMSSFDVYDIVLMPITLDIPFRLRVIIHFAQTLPPHNNSSDLEFIRNKIDFINTERWTSELLTKYFGFHFLVFQMLSRSGLNVLPFTNNDLVTTMCQEYDSPDVYSLRPVVLHSPCPSTSRLDYRFWGPCSQGKYSLQPRCFIGENRPIPRNECTRGFPNYPLISELPCDNRCSNGYTWDEKTQACDEPPFLFNLAANVTEVYLGENLTLNWDYHGDPRNTALITMHYLTDSELAEANLIHQNGSGSGSGNNSTIAPSTGTSSSSTTPHPSHPDTTHHHTSPAQRSFRSPRVIMSTTSRDEYTIPHHVYYQSNNINQGGKLPEYYCDPPPDQPEAARSTNTNSTSTSPLPLHPYHRLLSNFPSSGSHPKPVYLATVFALSEVAMIHIPIQYFTTNTYVFFRITLVRIADIKSDNSSTPTLIKVRTCVDHCDPDTERCNVTTGECECVPGYIVSSRTHQCIPMCEELCLNGGRCANRLLSQAPSEVPTECVCVEPYFGEFCEQSHRCPNICGKGVQLVLNDGLCGPCECLPRWGKDMKTQLCTRCLMNPAVNPQRRPSSSSPFSSLALSSTSDHHYPNQITPYPSHTSSYTSLNVLRQPMQISDVKPCFQHGTLEQSYIDCTSCQCKIGFMGEYCEDIATYGLFNFIIPTVLHNATNIPYQIRWRNVDVNHIASLRPPHGVPLYNLVKFIPFDLLQRIHEYVVSTLGILPKDAEIVQVTREEKSLEHVVAEYRISQSQSPTHSVMRYGSTPFNTLQLHKSKSISTNHHRYPYGHQSSSSSSSSSSSQTRSFQTFESTLHSLYSHYKPSDKFIETKVVISMTDSYIKSSVTSFGIDPPSFHSPRVLTLDALHKAWDDWRYTWNQTALTHDPNIQSTFGYPLPVGDLYEPTCRSELSPCPGGIDPFQGVVQDTPLGLNFFELNEKSKEQHDTMVTWIIIGCVSFGVLAILAIATILYCCKKHHYGCFKPSPQIKNELRDHERVQGNNLQQNTPIPGYSDYLNHPAPPGSSNSGSGSPKTSEWKLVREKSGHIYYLNRVTNDVVPLYSPIPTSRGSNRARTDSTASGDSGRRRRHGSTHRRRS